MNKKVAAILITAILLSGMVVLVRKSQKNVKEQDVPIMSSETLREKDFPGGQLQHDEMIQVSFPAPKEKIGGDIFVTGIAKGGWYFEGEFPVTLTDETGKELASVAAMAKGEWMKDEWVPFSAHLKYRVSDAKPAKLVLAKNNPSDIDEQNAQIEIPVVIEPDRTTSLIYFASNYRDANASICETVAPVARPVGENMAYSRQTLEELLSGPNEREKSLGYYSAIPPDVKIQNFDSAAKTARVDLSQELLNLKVDTACPRLLVEKQISETIKAASGAEKVVITVNGKPFPGEFQKEGPVRK